MVYAFVIALLTTFGKYTLTMAMYTRSNKAHRS